MRSRTCGTDAYVKQLEQEDAGYSLRRIAIEQRVQQATRQESHSQGQQLRQGVITIPVVFHVVYNSEEENISDEQLYSQLDILNADFRRLNTDAVNTPEYFQGVAADAEIEFCLATIDPEGNPTTGITRTRSGQSAFSYVRDNIKYAVEGGTNIWNSSQYLNIWICNIESGILGYATLPGAAAHRDGVVLYYKSVGAPPANPFPGPYNLGRTATHEVGHWLGLRHIWGSGSSCLDSDGIDDTPNQLSETPGCPSGINISCENGPFGNMYQNYMDYTNDNCMNLFTAGQVNFMKTVLTTTRTSIVNSIVCSYNLLADFEFANPADTLVAAGRTVTFNDISLGIKPGKWLWEFEGGMPATSTEQNPSVIYPRAGVYKVKLTISKGNTLTSTEEKEAFVNVTVNKLTIYPNPATDYLMVEQAARENVQQIEVVNSLGQTVLNATLSDRTVQLDVRHLPAGVYLVRVTSTNGTSVQKVSILRR